MEPDQVARRQTLRSLLKSERFSTQEELVTRLATKGFDVTQATLSRDLAKLNARRAVLPEGGTFYELGDDEVSQAREAPVLEALRHLVVSVQHNESLVVVTTLAGGASAVAREVDRARLPSVLGSIAGDDTIFVAPAGKSSAAALTKQLKSLWRVT